MSLTTTCPACHQLVAHDAIGIRPHARHGLPCAGGRAAPVPAPHPTPRIQSATTIARVAAHRATLARRSAKRDAIVRPHLPAPTIAIARATGLDPSAVRVSCSRLGAVLDDGTPRVWRLP